MGKPKEVKQTTKKPTGLSIKRSGNTFTLTWKIGDSNYKKGQWWDYLINDTGADKWHKKATKLGAKTITKSVKIDPQKFYPTKKKKFLADVRMRVKGKRENYNTGSGKSEKKHIMSVSAWATCIYSIKKPAKPTLSVELDNELTNRCVFSWTTDVSTTSAQMFYDTEWQTKFFKNSSEKDGSKLSWKDAESGTSTANNSRTRTEDTAVLYTNGDTWTRWFRVRSRGAAGASDWAYASHVYALPKQPQNVVATAEETEAEGFRCSVTWEAPAGQKNPIDKTTVQYTITVPDEGLKCPSGASWSDANISADTGESDGAVFNVDDTLSRDQCLFVRVNTQHDSYITYGVPILAKVGYLKDPSITSVTTDNVTHRATIKATNASEVEDSVLVVTYVASDGTRIDSGIIEHNDDEITVQCPNWDSQTAVAFEVRAIVGTYEQQEREDNVDSWAVLEKMASKNIARQGGTVPIAPQDVQVQRVGNSNTVQVMWSWSWEDANGAEISWADHEDAWESTEEPETYVISNLHASKWNIANLELGRKWYIRVRLLSGDITGEVVTKSPWSDITLGTIDLSSVPNKPKLELSKPVTTEGSIIKASWIYTTADDTKQIFAQVAMVVVEDVECAISEADYVVYDEVAEEQIGYKKVRNYDNIIAHAETQQEVEISTEGWQDGQTYLLACHVQSEAGKFSDWSEPESITIAEPIVCSLVLSNDSFETQTETVESIDVETQEIIQTTRTYTALYEMPLKVTVSGAGVKGQTTVAVERAESFHAMRPDESEFEGYKGETVLLMNMTGDGEVSFDTDDVIGSLDDTAQYKIIATVQDELGQVATAVEEFEVHWETQARIPSAQVSAIAEYFAVAITPIAPEQSEETDVCDIYRLSSDKPQLIVEGGEFGKTYVDPYPALNEHGGHRIVLRTKNGDYNTADNENAWVDVGSDDGDIIASDVSIIDFGGEQITIDHNFEVSNKWDKSFTSTQYLGGAVQGDWNVGVVRSGTIGATVITVNENEQVMKYRDLAEHSDVCHVRTIDGSSFTADVQVTESRQRKTYGALVDYSLQISKVDSIELDGMELAEWEEEHELE